LEGKSEAGGERRRKRSVMRRGLEERDTHIHTHIASS